MQGINPLEGSEKITEYAVNDMTVLGHFGLGTLVDELLEADGNHNLGNIISLETNVHQYFEKLELWFEGTNEVRYS
jgi:hypothetical protein